MITNTFITDKEKGWIPFSKKHFITTILCTTLFIPIISTNMVAAADYPPYPTADITTPIQGDYHFANDTVIIIPRDTPFVKYYLLAETDEKITVATGKTITIITDGDFLTPNFPDRSGIFADGGEIDFSNGKVIVTAYNTAAGASNGKLLIGDNSELYGLGSLKQSGEYVGSGIAVFAENNGELIIGNNVKLIGNRFGSDSATVHAQKNSSITIGNKAYITNDATGNLVDPWGNATLGDTLENHFAVQVYENSSIVIGTDSKIEVKSAGDGSAGSAAINASGSNSILSSVTIGDRAEIIAIGARTRGIEMQRTNNYVKIGDYSSITTDGVSGIAASVYYGAKLDLGESIKITTKKDSSYGVIAGGSGTEVNIKDKLEINTAGQTSIGLYSYDKAYISAGDGVKINTTGRSGYGLYSQATDAKLKVGKNLVINTSGQSGTGAYGTSGGTIEIDEGASISTTGNYAYGIYSRYLNSKVEVGKNAVIQTTGEEAFAVLANQGGNVILHGAEIVASGEYSAALYAVGDVDNSSGAEVKRIGKVTGDGKFNITGEMTADDYGKVDMTMKDGSVFNGYILTSNVEAEFDLNLYNAVWNITNDSNLTNMSLDGVSKAKIDFQESDIGTTITVDQLNHLTDGGLFMMKTDVAELTSDKVIINEVNINENSSHLIFVSDYKTPDSTATATGLEEVNLIQVKGTNRDNVVFGLSNINGQTIRAADLQGFQYELINSDEITDQNNWNLKGTGRASTDSDAAINTFAGGYLLNYAETQTLIQRLGDLRENENQKGAWARVYGGKYESSGSSFLSGFDMNYRGIQIGYDKKLKSDEKGDFYLGGMIGYSSGSLDYDRGKGEVDAKTLGVYGTYIKKDGFYTDFVLKYMWMENDFNVINIQGERVKGDKVDTGGLGTSIEIGKRYHKNKETKSGWYVEPQLQLSYGTQDGGTFTASNGNKIKVDSYDSFMGRVGMMIGYEDKKKEKNIYAKVSWVKEFDGDIGVNINGAQLDESFGDSWWVYGIGFTSKINSNQSIYLDIERATGGQFREPWAIKGGWRLSF